MTPLDLWVARANMARLRLMMAAAASPLEKARLEKLLGEELEKVRKADPQESDAPQ